MSLFLAVLGLHCCAGSSLVEAREFALVSGHRLLPAGASLVAEHGSGAHAQ